MRPLYAHWVRTGQGDQPEGEDHWTVSTDTRDPPLRDFSDTDCLCLQVTPADGVPSTQEVNGTNSVETAGLLGRLEVDGYCVVPAPAMADDGPVSAVVRVALGANYRATLRRRVGGQELETVARCDWPHDHAVSPIVADAAAKLLLHLTVHWALGGDSSARPKCQVLVGSHRAWSESSRMSAEEWAPIDLQPGEALILDSRSLRRKPSSQFRLPVV